MIEETVGQFGHSGEGLYNILAAALSKRRRDGAWWSSVLAQRAAWEGPRWTRAI